MRCLPHSMLRKSIDYFAEEDVNEKPTPKVGMGARCEEDSKRYRDRSRNGQQHGGAELLHRYRSHHYGACGWADYRYADGIDCVFDVCRRIDGPSADAWSFDDPYLPTHALV